MYLQHNNVLSLCNFFCTDQAVLETLIENMKSQTRFHSPDANDIDSIWQLLYPEHFINVLLIHHLKQRYQKDIEVLCKMD